MAWFERDGWGFDLAGSTISLAWLVAALWAACPSTAAVTGGVVAVGIASTGRSGSGGSWTALQVIASEMTNRNVELSFIFRWIDRFMCQPTPNRTWYDGADTTDPLRTIFCIRLSNLGTFADFAGFTR